MQRQINELNSRDTACVSFDAAMKYPMNLVDDRVKVLNMDGIPVEAIPYPGENKLKLLTDTLV